jgi:hypothetical protein
VGNAIAFGAARAVTYGIGSAYGARGQARTGACRGA